MHLSAYCSRRISFECLCVTFTTSFASFTPPLPSRRALSPLGLSFSSLNSLYNRQGRPHNRETTPKKAALESDIRELHNIPRDGIDEHPLSYPNIGDSPLSDESDDTC